MKKFVLVAVIFVSLFFSNYGRATITSDSVLVIPKTEIAPVIDGVLDVVWYNVSTILMEKEEQPFPTGYIPPENWWDIWGNFKMLWDDKYLYLFVQVYDDTNNYNNTNTYAQDGIELYFDADNSKLMSYDGYDDFFIRFNTQWTSLLNVETGYGGTGFDWGFFIVRSKFAFVFTELGYNFEAAFYLDDLQMEWDYDEYFGFEININDNDVGDHDSGWRWWRSDNDTWNDPSLFGTAVLENLPVGQELRVGEVYHAPVLDGLLEPAWDYAPDFTAGEFIALDNGAPVNWDMYSEVIDWNDTNCDFRLMWDEHYIYFFTTIRDDYINTSGDDDTNKDSIELFFNGVNNTSMNSGTGAFESTAAHFIFVYSDTTLDNVAFAKTALGWNAEGRIPFSELNFTPQMYEKFTFDIIFNDRDESGALYSGKRAWWGNDLALRQNPALWGPAVLQEAYQIKNEHKPTVYTYPATTVTETSAFLNGRVTTNADYTTAKFIYWGSDEQHNEIKATNSPIYHNKIVNAYVNLAGLVPNSTYHYYILAQNDIGAAQGETRTFTTLPATGVEDSNNSIPFTWQLLQNYPNPFNAETMIEFSLAKPSYVRLELYNISGEQAATLVSEQLNAGIHKINWDATGYAGGVYFYKLITPDFVMIKKLVYVR
ncbi:MAG TPA: sugar-binding protein [bacterium]|nr:sugar-binding protein [bacterium]HPN43330.1 sugar-binding protein [bacterium]